MSGSGAGGSGGLRVHVLGPLEVLDATGHECVVPGARLATLLVRLALEEGRPVSPATLIEDLWGSQAPNGELNALQSLVSRLRRALGGASSITQGAGGYRLTLATDGFDAARFRRLASDGRARLRAGDAAAAREVLAEALATWRGPVAAEVETLAPGFANSLEEQRVEAAADRVEAEQRLGRAADALDELALLRSRHPQHERLAALEITALVSVGRVADALRSYERIRRELADGLGVDPSPMLREAHLLALAADSAPIRSAPADEPRPGANLPAAVTSFLGRESELEQATDLLQSGRLVTILGPGGAGKTRLALETGRHLHRQSPASDVWLVELAGVTDEADVPQAVLAALGLREAAMLDHRTASRPARETLDLLVDRFAGRPTLLLLDNCEHVITAAASFADAALAACPNLRIAATSREPLAIAGEFLLPLAPLAVPSRGLSGEQVARLPAVELFIDRARAARPDFRLDEATRPSVEEIVRRLDGLPLAIELAAARMRTLPVAEIAERLSDRFRLLVTGSRTADERHRTLRAVVAWSWDLLEPGERLLAERVSVFPAGLTRASAAAVCADPSGDPATALDAAEVPDLLDALVEKSLLQLNRTGERYRVLETIREYGQERLVERGELDAVRLAAARHFAALVAEADPKLRSAEQIEWLDRLRSEHDNVIAALRTFCDIGDKDGALRLALDFGWYWFLLGRFADVTGWVAAAFALPGSADPELTQAARVVAALDRVAAEEWRQDRAEPPEFPGLVEELAAVPEGTRPMIAMFVPIVLFMSGSHDEARIRLDAAVNGPDPWLAAAARLSRARFAENVGDLATVREDTEQALVLFRGVGDQWGVVTALPLVGLLRLYDSDLDGALAAFLEAKRIGSLFGSLDLDDQLFLAFRLADVRLRLGQVDEARAVLDTARASIDETVQAEALVIFYALAAMSERVLGDLPAARRLQTLSEQALVGVRGGPLAAGHGVAVVSAAGAMLDISSGDLQSAATRLADGFASGVRARDYPILAAVGVAIADLAVALGRHRDAAVILGACTRLRGTDDPTQLDIRRIRDEVVEVLGAETAAAADAEGRALDAAAAIRRLDPELLKDSVLLRKPALTVQV